MHSLTSLPPGTRVGPYEVTGPIGSGGMGAVFRARDLNLRRPVALKVLPPDFVNDEERRTRFSREARLLAALNHPNIAQIYGIEDSPAGPAIAMELVEGRTVREVLRGPVSQADALAIAQQIATALDAAHERGIVHRDLKPANVMVTPEGVVKVLDFGLARTQEDGGDEAAVHQTTQAATAQGAVLGTPAYMSPEQARGQAVDRRTDIWAFGCLVFELYAGTPAFPGATIADTLAGVLEREPPWDALPAATPPVIRQLLRRCLEKDRRRRLRDIGDAILDLSSSAAAETSASSTAASGAPAPVQPGRAWLIRGLAVATVVLAAITAWLGINRPGQATPARMIRFTQPPPPGTVFGSSVSSIEATTLSVAPDGSRLAFVAMVRGGESRIWIRALADEAATAIPGTEGAISMFWSPDSATIAFFANGQLKRVEAAGGPVSKICNVPARIGLSGSWGADGAILFASVQADRIQRVAASGGTPVTHIEPAADQPSVREGWPTFLPDGRRFLYARLTAGDQGQIVLAEPDGTKTPLVDARSRAIWVEPDWLLFVREGTLLAQRVDLDGRRVIGEPVSIVGSVAYSAATAWSNVAASLTGVIMAQTHGDQSHVTWFDADGTERSRVGAPGTYFTLRLSDDDQKLLFARLRPELGTYDIWTADLTRGSETRLTTSPGMETGEVWVKGADVIAYAASAGGPPNLHLRHLATSEERRLLTSPRFQFPNDVSPAGDIVYQQRTDDGSWDLLQTTIDDPARVTPVLVTPAAESGLRFAPGGTRAAFMSDESGRLQVYVAGFPLSGPRIDVSSPHGGRAPRWRRDGRALYFLSASNQLMEVEISPTGVPGTARRRFDATGWTDFDVARDGRFVAVVTEVIGREQPLGVIVNWPVRADR